MKLSIPAHGLMLAMLAFLAAGCGTLQVAPSAPAAAPAASAEPVAAAPPARPLDAESLYQILLGEIAQSRGQVGVAAAALGRVAERTGDPRLAERATYAALYARRYDDALKVAQQWAAARPNDIDPHEALGLIYMELERPAQARVEFDTLIALDKEVPSNQAYMRIAAILSRQSNRSAALSVMEEIVAARPNEPAAHVALAHLAVRLGDLDRAQAAVDSALKLRPEAEEVALFKARIYVSQKEMLKAQRYYEDYLRQYPGASTFRLNYARHLIDQKQWDKARAEFKRVLADTPDDADAVYAVGLLALQTNNLDEAEKYLKRTLQLRPQNDMARISLGQVAEQQKRLPEALRHYREVPPGDHYFEAQLRIGMLIAREGDTAKALAHLRALTPETDPQRVQRVLSEEQVLREARQSEAALQVLNKGLEEVPNDKDLLYARALVAEKLNRLDIAERDLRAVLKQDPKHAHALNALGYTLADRTNRLKEANELLTQALALKPDDPFILDSMGWLQYRLGNHAEAVKYLKRALEVRSDAEIAAHLGEVLWVMGNQKEAESVWGRALKDTPDNEALQGVIKKFKQ